MIRRVSAAFASLILVVIALAMFAAPAHAADNVIDSITIDVTVHKDGSATVTDERQYTFNDATEHYIPFAALGESEITDVSVSQDGTPMEESTPWDVDRSLEEKAGQFGIVDTDDGLEIAWGIGSEGAHTSEVSYIVTNFVRTLTDGQQAIYWQFLHEGMTDTNNVEITVRNDAGFDFTADNTHLQGYGFEGEAQIRPGALKMSTDTYHSDSRAVMLAIMPPNTFDTSASWPWNAEEIKAQADEGTQPTPPGVIAAIIAGALAIVGAILALLRSYLSKRPAKATGFAPSSRKIEHTTSMPDGEVLALSGLYHHTDEQKFVAYLLKWILGRNLIEQEYEVGVVLKRPKPGLRIAQPPAFENDCERQLWDLITAAAGEDDLIEQSEIKDFFAKKRTEFTSWSENVRDYSTDYLATHGYTIKVRKTGLFPRDEYELTELGRATVDQMDGFKKYLRDGWHPDAAPQPEKHLMWAGFLGALKETQRRLGDNYAFYPAVYAANSMTTQAAQGFAPASTSAGGGAGAAGAASGGGAR